MFVKNLLRDINLTRVDILYLGVLMIFSLFITSKSISMVMDLNIHSDVLVYLTNALIYSGLSENIHNTSTFYLSPVISYLTGILMTFGITGKESIYYVTGFFSIMANVAMYILLKYRFNRLLSLLGAILFGSLYIVLKYWADGSLDVAVISVSIWTIIFIILAVYENPKYYLLCFPLLVFSIFTRYSAFFMLPLVMLYFFSKNDFFNNVDLLLHDRDAFRKRSREYLKSRDFIYLMAGIILGIIIFLWICNVIISHGSGLTFITQISESLGGFEGPKYYNDTFGYQPNDTYYIDNFIYMLNFDPVVSFGMSFSKLILILVVISVSIHLINLTVNFNVVREFASQKRSFRVRHFDKALWILVGLMLVMFVYELSYSHLWANISMLVAMVAMFSLLDKYPISKKFYSMNFLCLAWFLIYLIFYSMISIKAYRYMISAIPPLVYFIVWSLEAIFRTVHDGFETNDAFRKKHQLNLTFNFSNDKRGDYFRIVAIILIASLMLHAAAYEKEFVFNKYDNSKLNKVFDFIVTNDTNFTSKNISTDAKYYSRYGTWYLKKDVVLNETMFNGTPTDDYVIKNHKVENFTGYKRVVKTDKMSLYANENNTVLLNFMQANYDKNIGYSTSI